MPADIGWPVHFYLDATDEAALDVRFYRLQGADGLLCTRVQDQASLYLFPCIQPDRSPRAYRATVDEDHCVNSIALSPPSSSVTGMRSFSGLPRRKGTCQVLLSAVDSITSRLRPILSGWAVRLPRWLHGHSDDPPRWASIASPHLLHAGGTQGE